MKRVLFLLTFIFMGIGMATAQTATITGKVYSEADGEPVFGASVFVVGTSVGAGTDMEGNFTIENVPATATTLRVSYVGMTTQEVQIVRGKPMRVILVEDGVTLDDVVVVAYGSAKREAVTGSVTSVKGETLASAPVTSVDKALSGKLAGVQVTASSGQPGAASQIRIRGNSSINASNAPLWVVDGIPVVSGGTGEMTNTSNGIATINPNDIESITVLKDAAAQCDDVPV